MQRIHMNTNKNSTEEYAYCMDVVIKGQSPRLGLNCVLPAPSFVFPPSLMVWHYFISKKN
uniref:Uncharacterized protein n=1 Tax=Cucumis melo TaxID=3656 RepID=A0A9I9EBT9_CUCME